MATVLVNFRLDSELHQQLHRIADGQGLTLSSYIRLKVFGTADLEVSQLSPDITLAAPNPATWEEARQRYIQRSLEIAEQTRALQDDWYRWSRALTGDMPPESHGATLEEIARVQREATLGVTPSPRSGDE